MDYRYIFGVILAILAGISTFLGQVLQKVAVNNIPKNNSQNKYKYLLKNKIWLLGLVLYIVLATIFYMVSELLIGPVLIPGLMSFGLIVLIIASIKIANEKITLKLLAGIIMIIIGTIMVTYSKLQVDYRIVNIENNYLIEKITIFSLIIFLLWVFTNYIVKISHRYKAIFKSVAAGFPYALSNLWIFPLYISMNYISTNQTNLLIWIIFAVSCIILIVANILGITELQIAYKLGNVSLIVPVQQIPIQIAPVVYYYIFYSGFEGKPINILIGGIILIVASGFIFMRDLNTTMPKNP